MKKQERKNIFVGLSGGVDSSVAALRLLRAGYSVTGVFIKVWQPDFLKCDWEQERLDAMRVAATLQIPFRTFDAEAIYKKEVVDHMISEYKAGRTPNPDVMCNQHVKFGVFLQYAREQGADAIATGHYARRSREFSISNSQFSNAISKQNIELLKGVDENKDQSYFLWTLTQEELAFTHFPVGDSAKEDIRKEAERNGLPNAHKKDSQGICFLGQIDMRDFLSHYITPEEGDVLDMNGTPIGRHEGALFYTIGQRHGFTVTHRDHQGAPHYIHKKDTAANVLYVSAEPPVWDDARITLSDVHWIDTPYSVGADLEVVTRYRERPREARIVSAEERTLILELAEALHAPTPGQSCVLYDGNKCLGGGIMDHIIH